MPIAHTLRRPRLVLAEDHRETAEQLRKLLEADFEVVALVGDGPALVTAVARLAPDAIVTDISMPGLDGLDAAALILRGDPEARIVLVTVHCDSGLVQRSLETGVLGYVLKDAAGDELVSAVRAALGGRLFVSRALDRSGDKGSLP